MQTITDSSAQQCREFRQLSSIFFAQLQRVGIVVDSFFKCLSVPAQRDIDELLLKQYSDVDKKVSLQRQEELERIARYKSAGL